MKCPSCLSEMRISHRQNVEIDVCPSCRGVWLDRGEVDKLVERASRYDDEAVRDDVHHAPKRKTFWSDMFD